MKKWITNIPENRLYSKDTNEFYGENWLEKYEIGNPKGTKAFPVKKLKRINIVGIYKK